MTKRGAIETAAAIRATKPVDAQEFFAAERLKWSEAEFQNAVLAMAADLGWSHRYHTNRSDRSGKGFPDLVLVRPGVETRILFAELKTMAGKTSVEQGSWLAALGRVAYLWRPCCWNSGEIEKVLR